MSLLRAALAFAVASPAMALSPPTTTTTTPAVRPTVTATTVTFQDGTDWRQIERLGGGRVRYLDVATGRSTIAGLGDTALLQINDGSAVDVVAARHGLQVVRPAMASIGLYVVRSLRGDDGAVIAARVQQGGDIDVVAAFPNLAFAHTTMTTAAEAGIDVPPSDARYAAQFYLQDLEIEGAWALQVGDPDVVVAVVDNGCDAANNNHGTACAGLIAASTDNDLDIAGSCPRCSLTCTRLLAARGEPVPLDADVRAFEHAFVDGVDVVSNSWGFVDAIPVPAVLSAAIVHVQQNGRRGLGAVVVFASGNDNREVADDELLAVPGVIGVGAVNNLGELTQFSNRGRAVDIVAPTGTVATDISGPGGDSDGDVTFRFGGTSSAAPLVSGIAGLLLAHDPTLTADEVALLLEQTARQSIFARPDAAGHDLEYGFGLVQPALALAAAVPPPLPPDPAPAGDVLLGGGGCASSAAAAALAPMGLLLLRRRRRHF